LTEFPAGVLAKTKVSFGHGVKEVIRDLVGDGLCIAEAGSLGSVTAKRILLPVFQGAISLCMFFRISQIMTPQTTMMIQAAQRIFMKPLSKRRYPFSIPVKKGSVLFIEPAMAALFTGEVYVQYGGDRQRHKGEISTACSQDYPNSLNRRPTKPCRKTTGIKTTARVREVEITRKIFPCFLPGPPYGWGIPAPVSGNNSPSPRSRHPPPSL